jgi:hypothetical protein
MDSTGGYAADKDDCATADTEAADSSASSR